MTYSRFLGMTAVAAMTMTGVLTAEPKAGFSSGVNGDSVRQRCEFYRTKALFGNRKARAGQISERERVNRWLRYKSCVGTRDYLMPAEFK